MSLAEALADRPALARALAACGVELARLEASVRAGPTGPRGDRMMIERAGPGVLEVLLEAFGVPRVAALDALERAIAAHGLPRIVGWDAARGCVKLYANASDAPVAARAALGAHVVGVNVFCDGLVEEKRYVQRVDAAGLGAAAARLVERAGAHAAGIVESRDPHGTLRAVFVALRPASPEALDAAFGALLPGFSFSVIAARSPFEPASPRSVGIAIDRPEEWTAYVKPRAADEPELHSLEPHARVPCGDGELAVYLAPAASTARAYAVVGDRAVSYRVVSGAPGPDAIRAVMDRILRELE